MLKVTKRAGSPYWQIHGTVAGQRVRQSSGTPDRATAQAAASHLESRLRREQQYGKEHETTFGDAALAYIESKRADNAPVCSAQYLREIIRRVGTRTLASFSPGEIQDIAKALHPSSGAATRNRHGIAPFMAVYNHAVRRKLAPPMVVERFKEQTPKTVSVDRAWIEAVRAAMPDPHARAMVLLMFETGMRLGTVIALEPAMVSTTDCIISVPGSILKNDDPHEFIISATLADELAVLPKHSRDQARLFGFRYGSGFYRHLKRACQDAGVSYVPPHQSGRHSMATHLIVDHGIDPVTVAELGGWKDVAHLMKRYPHARAAKLRAVVERVSSAGKKPALKSVK